MDCPECGNESRDGARFCDNCGTALESEPAARAPAPSATDPGLAEGLTPPPADAPPTVGAGRFETVGFLGEGTRKRVYAARDRERDGGLVAVAVFSTEGMAATAQVRARREAEAMATLGVHPHLVPVLASGQDGDRPYIVSEYMPGGDLGDLLESASGRQLEVERAIAIAAELASGLQYAHDKGIVHRDIKPANVWLDSSSAARLGDFGLATEARARDAVGQMLVGTAAYLPPEQAIGRRTDERADLYSLGALLYEMLAGEPPFPGDDPVSIISRHLSTEPMPPSRHNPAVPPRLDLLVAALLAKAPDDRPRTAREVRDSLLAIDPEQRAGEDPKAENPLDGIAAGLFVGRDAEFELLRGLLDGAIAGKGGVGLIEGEPGIGKTRMVEELVTYARVRGARVLTTSCQEADAVPAFWPFAEAIRSYIGGIDPVGLAWQLGERGSELARLVPELPELVPSVQAPAPLEGDESRFQMFEAVAGFLEGISRSRPLLLVLDDLHWADSSSIELLRFLSHRVADAPMLIVCAYRGEEAAARENLKAAIAELDESAHRERILLSGLDRDAIEQYVRLSTGAAAPAELIAEIAEQTGGNPFFVGEVVRLIATEGGIEKSRRGRQQTPRGVREAVSRRIERLPDEVSGALSVGAVLGREFDLGLLAEVFEVPSPPDLGPALAARIIELSAGDGDYIFSHAVFREAFYEALPAARRRRLHARAGAAVEALCGDDPDPQLQVLARHFLEAGPEHTGTARRYALAAARQAARRVAHTDAAEYLERAVGLLPAADPEAVALRIELGRELTRCGRPRDAHQVLLEAAAMAAERDQPEALADAAIALAAVTETGSKDDELVAICEAALAGLGDRLPAKQAHLLAALSWEHYWDDVDGAARAAGSRALEVARASGDDGALAGALAVRQFTMVGRPGMIEARLRNAEEMLAAARRAGEPHEQIRAIAYLVTGHLQAGDVTGAERALADFKALAERLREPRHLWHVPMMESTLAMIAGRFDDARRLSAEAARLGGEVAGEPLALQFHVVQMGLLHVFEGTPEEILPVVRPMVARYPALPAWRLALINFLVDADRIEDARDEYESVVARSFDEIPLDANWLVGLTRLGESAARLGDRPTCADLLERLAGYAGEVVVIGRAGACSGPVDRYLGLMAAALDRHTAAVEHFEAALAICERMGERPIRAETRLHLGQSLLERGDPGDRDRALELLSLALEQGQELGMRKLVERAVRARLEAQGVAGIDAGASIDSVAEAVADERPDLVSYAAADGRVTILFSDIENSTLMTERLGDERWIAVLRSHNAVFRRRVAEFGGNEVKNQGDGFMLAFPDPLGAVECALAVQVDLEDQEGPESERIRVRMGMHVGEVIEEEGDYFGRSVILAARIAAQARGGELLISEALLDAGAEALYCDDGRELELKGLAGTHRAYRVEAAHRSALSHPVPSEPEVAAS